jgi:hypothetical protein
VAEKRRNRVGPVAGTVKAPNDIFMYSRVGHYADDCVVAYRYRYRQPTN